MRIVRLIAHSSTPSGVVRGIEVQVHRSAETTIELRYLVEGDMGRLLIPSARPPGRSERLWQHTCFEAFVAAGREGGYYELNFSPSGEWAIYHFSRYRAAMTAVAATASPRISTTVEGDRLVVVAVLDLSTLPDLRDGADLRMALSAVIEDTEHRLSYWALAHPPGKPDFHHPDGFALEVPLPHPPHPDALPQGEREARCAPESQQRPPPANNRLPPPSAGEGRGEGDGE